MATGAPRLCTHPSCGALVFKGYRCDKHPYPENKKRNDRSASPGYLLYRTKEWKSTRAAQLLAYPYCADCAELGTSVKATVVDHREPHKGDAKLFFKRSNLVSLCRNHHNRKTAKHDGGFGNPIRSKDEGHPR